MTAPIFVQPDWTAQDANSYRTNLDNAVLIHAHVAGAFAPEPQSTPDMTVAVAGGVLADGTVVALQNTGTISAPSGDDRIDLISLDPTDGSLTVTTGSEASSPSAPSLPSGNVAIAEVYLEPGQSEIVAADITDRRGYQPVASAAAYPIGTSGATVPLCDEGITWGGAHTHTNTSKWAFNNSLPVRLYRTNSALGVGVGIQFALEDSGDAEQAYAQIFGLIVDNTPGSEDGEFAIYTAAGGTVAKRFGVKTGFFANGLSDPGAGRIAAVAYHVATENITFQTNDRGVIFRNTGGGDDARIKQDSSNQLHIESGTGNAIVFYDNNATNEYGRFNNSGLSLAADTDTYLTRSASNEWSFYAGGAQKMVWGVGATILSLIYANDSAANGPEMRLYRDSASPAANDEIGRIRFTGKNSSGSELFGYVRLSATIDDPTAGSEDGIFSIDMYRGGALVPNAFTLKDGLALGTPTGGDKGLGTLNVSGGLYVNNQEVYHPSNPPAATGMVAIERKNSTVDTATLDFTSGIDGTYNRYCLKGWLLPATDANELRIQTDSDGGASFDGGAGDYKYSNSGAGGAGSSNADTKLVLTGDSITGVSSDADEGVWIDIEFEARTGSQQRFTWIVDYNRADDAEWGRVVGGGARLSTTIIDAVRLLFRTGDISAYDVTLYGIVKE